MSFGEGCPSWVARMQGERSGYGSGYSDGKSEMEKKLKAKINQALGKRFLVSFKEKAKEEIMKSYKLEKEELLSRAKQKWENNKERLTKKMEKDIREEIFQELEHRMYQDLNNKIQEEKNNLDSEYNKRNEELDDEYKILRKKVENMVKEEVNKELTEKFRIELEKFKTSIKNKDDIILLPNLKIIIDYVPYGEGINSEEFVKNKFESMGYKVINATRYCGGHPDLICENGLNRFFVEVKSPSDSLRLNQAKWILNNKDKEVILYLLDYEENQPKDKQIVCIQRGKKLTKV